MTTPKMICMTCGTGYPVGTMCPRCGPHKPGAELLEALHSHGSGIAPDPFEQSECQDCAMKDQLIKVAGEQLATLTAELSLARVSAKIEGDAVHKIRTSVPNMVHELLPDLLDDVLLRLATITADRDAAVVVLQKVEHGATVFSMRLKEYCPGCPCCGRPYNEPHWPACELNACLPKEGS